MHRPVTELNWWLSRARGEDSQPAEPLTGEIRADVCIVGGGYTGLCTALRIKKQDPATHVVLLEARICGNGASGRNRGFALSWWEKLATLIKLFGAEEGIRLAEASAEAARHGREPFRPCSPDDVASAAGSATHVGGVFEPAAATVQPALLARGLRRVAIVPSHRHQARRCQQHRAGLRGARRLITT